MNGPLLRRPNLVKGPGRNLKLWMLRLNFAVLTKLNHVGIPMYAFAKKGIRKTGAVEAVQGWVRKLLMRV